MEDHRLPPWEVGVRQGGNMNIAVMTENLLDFKLFADTNGLQFVLFFGTLLGLKRNKSFIEWDTDVDVICFWDQYLKWHKIKDQLKKSGFSVVDEKPLHDEHLVRKGEKIEIWWSGKVKEQLVYDDNIRFNSDLILPTKKENFLGTTFEIPAQSERILELLYGKNWMIPCTKTKGCNYKADKK